ncbi:MAG: FAD-dependent oxidoreductase [Desulfatirhabdiaceae bacterium]
MINRNINHASRNTYDLIIVGGGIYGITLSLTASQIGLKSLLLERDDFGGATSFNSLRIIHGGLRYLQHFDFKRYMESVLERRWFFQNFPEFVKPIPCLMPLYGNGPYRPSVFFPALLLNDLLSFRRNERVLPENMLPCGRIVPSSQVTRIFPEVNKPGLKGGAIWFDGAMDDSQILTIEILKWACSLGATAVNYCGAEELLTDRGNVIGVRAKDYEGGNVCEFRAPVVVNAAGPWCRQISARFHRNFSQLFRSSIAWNVLLNKNAVSDHALALTPDRAGARTCFIRPWKGLIFAGTVHEPWDGIVRNPVPGLSSIRRFLQDINQCIPGLNADVEDILRIYSGLMPAKAAQPDQPADREVIIDHSCHDGPLGLFSVSGVKFTTARRVAEKTLRQIFPGHMKGKHPLSACRPISQPVTDNRLKWDICQNDESWKPELLRIIQGESVLHLDDLMVRRTTIGDTLRQAMSVGEVICDLFGWNSGRSADEMDRLKRHYDGGQKN